MSEPEVATTDAERRARRRRLTILLTPVVFFLVCGQVVSLLAPTLIKHHPLVVIFFVPINRWMIIAVDRIDSWVFYSVSFFRLVLTDPLFFLLGRWYGDGALDWIENKTGNSGMIPWTKKWFGRAGPVFVFFAPNNIICMLAGSSRMNPYLFVGLNVTGTAVRLFFIKKTANLFKPVLDPILRFVDHYRWPLVAISIALFAFQQLANRKRGKGSEIQSVGKMADELEASIEAHEAE